MHLITIAAASGRRSLIALAGAATLAGGLAAAPAPASAAVVSCGATITQDTKLTGDVTGCKGHGIRIGADGITLDLNGHTVSAAAVRNGKAHGILNKGHDGVTIRGGTVRGFGAYGVRLAGVQRNHVRAVRMIDNFTGIGLVVSARNTVDHNEIAGAKFVGVNVTGGARNRIVSNSISDSNGPGVLLQSAVDSPSRRNAVIENQISGNGIQVNPGQLRARLIGNAITGASGDGILVFEPTTLVRANSANDNRGHGIHAPNGAREGGANAAQGNGLEPQIVFG